MIVFPLEREQEDKFHGISQSKIKIVIYTKLLQKGLEYVARELSVMITRILQKALEYVVRELSVMIKK